MKRSGPLKRRTPLKRQSKKAARKQQKYTETRQEVAAAAFGKCQARADSRCQMLGDQAHHLKRRSQGGKDTPENLIWVCWRCHNWIHANPEKARAADLLR